MGRIKNFFNKLKKDTKLLNEGKEGQQVDEIRDLSERQKFDIFSYKINRIDRKMSEISKKIDTLYNSIEEELKKPEAEQDKSFIYEGLRRSKVWSDTKDNLFLEKTCLIDEKYVNTLSTVQGHGISGLDITGIINDIKASIEQTRETIRQNIMNQKKVLTSSKIEELIDEEYAGMLTEMKDKSRTSEDSIIDEEYAKMLAEMKDELSGKGSSDGNKSEETYRKSLKIGQNTASDTARGAIENEIDSTITEQSDSERQD